MGLLCDVLELLLREPSVLWWRRAGAVRRVGASRPGRRRAGFVRAVRYEVSGCMSKQRTERKERTVRQLRTQYVLANLIKLLRILVPNLHIEQVLLLRVRALASFDGHLVSFLGYIYIYHAKLFQFDDGFYWKVVIDLVLLRLKY